MRTACKRKMAAVAAALRRECAPRHTLFYGLPSMGTIGSVKVRVLIKGKRQILMQSDTKLLQPFVSWSNSL